jgi:hypothetical protein
MTPALKSSLSSTVLRFALGAAVLGTLGACEPPQHPRRYSKTLVENLCHVAYDCCTAVERNAVVNFRFADKASCLEELDAVFGGALDAAVEAVDRGTATFDAEAARSCTEDQQAAIDRCEGGAAFLDVRGSLSGTLAGAGIAADDATCAALVARGFTRGTIDDGDDCLSSFECADFGECVVDDDNGATLTRSGTCRAAAGKGDDCDDRPCQPGLVCVSGACDEAPAPAKDGEPCVGDALCESGVCSDENGAPVCAPAPEIDPAICDGRALFAP